MDKFQYYFRKKFLDGDANTLQDNIEGAIDRLIALREISGFLGPDHGVTPGTGFTFQLTSNNGTEFFRGFDRNGQFVSVDLEPYISDDLSSLFSLPAPGNDKWLTFVLRFLRVEDQEETEKKPPVFTQVYFQQNEGFEIAVVEGVAAPTGTAVPPDISSEVGVYLADVLVNDTSADFTVAPPVIDSTRVVRDPLSEAVQRGMDGVAEKILLTGDLAAQILVDHADVTANGAAAFLAAQGAGADGGANRLALLSETGLGVSESAIFIYGTPQTVANYLFAVHAIPVGVPAVLIEAHVYDWSGGHETTFAGAGYWICRRSDMASRGWEATEITGGSGSFPFAVAGSRLIVRNYNGINMNCVFNNGLKQLEFYTQIPGGWVSAFIVQVTHLG